MIYLQDSKIKVQDSQHVAKVFQDLLLLEDKIDQEKEHFYVLHLDIRNRIKMVECKRSHGRCAIYLPGSDKVAYNAGL